MSDLYGNIILRSRKGGYKDIPAIFTVGGYCFIIQEKSIPFDWDDMMGYCTIDKEGYVEVEADLTYFAGEEYYEEDYREEGLSIEDITPDFLIQVEEIWELNYECYEDIEAKKWIDLELVSFKINDKDIPEDVIKKYNDNQNCSEVQS